MIDFLSTIISKKYVAPHNPWHGTTYACLTVFFVQIGYRKAANCRCYRITCSLWESHFVYRFISSELHLTWKAFVWTLKQQSHLMVKIATSSTIF
jgi:hypothetical protein